MGKDGKAEIIDQKKLKQCGGEKVCSMGAIVSSSHQHSPFGGKGMGEGKGRGA